MLARTPEIRTLESADKIHVYAELSLGNPRTSGFNTLVCDGSVAAGDVPHSAEFHHPAFVTGEEDLLLVFVIFLPPRDHQL